MSTLSARNLRSVLGGRFFSVTFVKKDGSERKMVARCGVVKHTNGGSLSYDAYGRNHLPVWDVQNRGYRMVNCNTIKSLKCGEISF